MLQVDGRSLGCKLFKNYHLSQPKCFKPLILVGKLSVLGGEGMHQHAEVISDVF